MVVYVYRLKISLINIFLEIRKLLYSLKKILPSAKFLAGFAGMVRAACTNNANMHGWKIEIFEKPSGLRAQGANFLT